jgi:DNA-binding transcriptional regulator YhcF (GntR family)
MQVSTQMGPFSIVPEWVLDRGLSSTALKLYIVLARFADWDTGIAFPARDTLAERMGCTEKTVDRVVKELVEAECIDKHSRGRYQSAQYRVLQVDPRGTKMSTDETKMSGEGTKMSSRLDKNVHLTRTNEQEPFEQKPINVVKPTKRRLVADDYQPSNKISDGFDDQYPGLILEDELEKFRDHHMAVGSDFKDWDRAFRKWLRNALQWSPEARMRKAQTISDDEWEAWKREKGYE